MRLGLLWPWAAFCHFPPRKCLACEFFFFLYCHLYEHQAVCYGHSAFLATSEEVLSAQLEFLACVWARLTWKITHVLQTSLLSKQTLAGPEQRWKALNKTREDELLSK